MEKLGARKNTKCFRLGVAIVGELASMRLNPHTAVVTAKLLAESFEVSKQNIHVEMSFVLKATKPWFNVSQDCLI